MTNKDAEEEIDFLRQQDVLMNQINQMMTKPADTKKQIINDTLPIITFAIGTVLGGLYTLTIIIMYAIS